jgi:hypothetical protein
MAHSLLGKFCLDSKQNLESGRGVLKLTKVLALAEKHECDCGEWSERLVIQDPATAATKFCSQMAPLSMKLWSESWATLVKARGTGYRAQHYLLRRRIQARASTAVFLLEGQVAR